MVPSPMLRGMLVEQAVRSAVGIAPDPAAGGVRRRGLDARAASAAPLSQRVWWSWAQSAIGRPGATRSRSAAVGPGRPAVGRPAMAQEPAVAVARPARAACGVAPRRSSAASSDAAPSRSTSSAASAASTRWRCASVTGQHDLAGRELHRPRAGARQRPRSRGGAGGDDPPVADREALQPAEPRLARQARDAPEDDEVRRPRLTAEEPPQPGVVQAGAESQGERDARLGAAQGAGQDGACRVPTAPPPGNP